MQKGGYWLLQLCKRNTTDNKLNKLNNNFNQNYTHEVELISWNDATVISHGQGGRSVVFIIKTFFTFNAEP